MNTKHPSWSGLSTYPLNFPTPATALHSASLSDHYFPENAMVLLIHIITRWPSVWNVLLLHPLNFCSFAWKLDNGLIWDKIYLSPNPSLIRDYCSRKVQKNSSTKENLFPTLTGPGAEKQQERIYKKYNEEKNLKYHYENLQREREYTASTKKDIVLYFVEEERE